MRKSNLFVLLAIVVLVLSMLACNDGPTVVDTGNDVQNMAHEIQTVIKSIDSTNQQIFGADGQPQCIYVYRDGHSEGKAC